MRLDEGHVKNYSGKLSAASGELKVSDKPECRVLQVFSSLGVGGAETWLIALLRYFKEAESVLFTNGWIRKGNCGRGHQRKEILPGSNNRRRCYVFDMDYGDDE